MVILRNNFAGVVNYCPHRNQDKLCVYPSGSGISYCNFDDPMDCETYREALEREELDSKEAHRR